MSLRLFVLVVFSSITLPICRAESIWIESETAVKSVPGAGDHHTGPELLSGGKVFALNLSSKEVAGVIPEDGLVVSHPFAVKSGGTFTLWNRVGFEAVRTPFEWRVDGGEWVLNSQESQPITNVQELAFWNPIGWTRMGEVALEAGDHLLEIRLTRALKNAEKPDGGFDAIRYVSDAIVVSSDPFRPNYGHRPGEPWEGQSAGLEAFVLEDSEDPRTKLALDGVWQFAPWDEIGAISETSRVRGVEAAPDTASLHWYDLPVPSDRNTALPLARFAHRYVMR
jgi:hypothetical protein